MPSHKYLVYTKKTPRKTGNFAKKKPPEWLKTGGFGEISELSGSTNQKRVLGRLF